ncbi:MAG: hypothetical protein V2J89_16530 [Halieaceae bacterium]|jgi:hypothetical protein|nr:hypothetical protein [Halieaceae bacterium]
MATATPKKKASPKAKTRKAPARKTAARKTATKRTAQRKTAAAPVASFTTKAQENARNVFLASLGFYGKAFEQAQTRFDAAQSRIKTRRTEAEKLFSELVKRGEKVESDARKAINDIELPELKLAKPEEIRKDVKARLEKARESFETLRGNIGSNAA